MVVVMNNNNIIDKFLDRVEKEANKKIVYQRIYQRPSKAKSIIGFIASLAFFIVMLGLFSFSGFFFLLFISDIIILIFYGVNVFTEKGIGLPKTIAIELPSEEEMQEIENEEEEEIDYFPDLDDEEIDEEEVDEYEDERRQ